MTPRRIAIVVAVILALPFLLLGALILVVQSEWGERRLEKSIASRIHREVQVEGIKVHFQWPPTLGFERVRIGNPEWARTHDLIDAQGLTARILFLPLLQQRLIVPSLQARKAKAGLEQSADRATWRFDAEQKAPSRVELGRVLLEDGFIVYRHEDEDTAIEAKVTGNLGEKGELKVDATGKFRGEPAKGTATFPALDPQPTQPIRVAGKALIGKTDIAGDGTFGTDFKTLDLNFKLAGQTLKDLRKVFGVLLPDTPPYRMAGRLRHEGNDWKFSPFQGTVGDSDLRGTVVYVTGGKRPTFRGDLQSNLLDFDDLGPLIGAPPKTGPGETAAPQQQAKAAALQASARILPREKFSTERWGAMDADVRLVAKRVQRPQAVPIDSLSTHLVLKDAVLHLQPLNFGVAGGKVVSDVVIDAHPSPPVGTIKAEVQGLKLAQLFPALKTMDEALGSMYGRAELKGRGASVGDLIGTSDGKIVLAANGGRVSDLLVQLLEIDVAHAAMLLGTRKQQVDLRCAVGTFAVKHGVAEPETFVVDTTETNVKVSGKIDLNQERFDLQTHGKGKSPSVLVIRSPIVMEGPLKKPSIHPKAGPIALQVGAAAALAAAAPPLAIVPFLDAGTGKDADCDKLLADARGKGAEEKAKTASKSRSALGEGSSSGNLDPSDRASAAAPATPKRRKDVASAAGN